MNMNLLLLFLPALVTANKCAGIYNLAGQPMSAVAPGVDPTTEPPKCVSVKTGACAGYVNKSDPYTTPQSSPTCVNQCNKTQTVS